MCGFVGGIFREPVDERDVAEMRRAGHSLAHRGPDADGLTVVHQLNAVLAFRRLSIIDLVSGSQPMATGHGQHIVFNGEIYNYRELRPKLERAGIHLRTQSDTEVLLWKLSENLAEGLADAVGMFGFAFLDEVREILMLGRDRLGVKQVYHATTPRGFFFASEPKALLALQGVSSQLSPERLYEYFNYRCVPAPHTLFEGIQKLPAGTTLTVDLRTWKQSLQRFWSLPDLEEHRRQPLASSVDQVEEALLNSVKRRLVADVPVGAFLSGGLDSSLVVAAMRRLRHDDLRTFSAVFPGDDDDEGPFARRVAARFGARHFEHVADGDSFLENLPEWVFLNDDLVADASCLPLLAVSRLARAHDCKVLLSGEGADEIFAGYGSYHKYVLLNRLAALIPGQKTRERVLQLFCRSGLLQMQDLPRARAYLVDRAPFMGTAALLGRRELARFFLSDHGWVPPIPRGAALEDLCIYDFGTRIPEDLMVRTDRATMGASVEARVPFLDHELVQICFGLPAAARARIGISKLALRVLARRWNVPRQTILHRKIGFQLPIGTWLKTELKPLWSRILHEQAIPGLSYRAIREVYDAHYAGVGRYEEFLWRVTALELWYRRWVLGGSDSLPNSDTEFPSLEMLTAAGTAR